MAYEIKFEDNSNIFKADYKRKKMKMTYAIGLKWQQIATMLVTNQRIVDTGRLRASLSFLTPYKKSGANPTPVKPGTEISVNDHLRGLSGEDNTIIVGSNVSYAADLELNGRKGAFIKPAILEYREDYKNITEAIMKED